MHTRTNGAILDYTGEQARRTDRPKPCYNLPTARRSPPAKLSRGRRREQHPLTRRKALAVPSKRSMFIPKKIVRASSLAEALQAQAHASGTISLLAGGTDLLLDLQQGRHAPVDCLIDVSQVTELQRLELDGEEIFIGAGVPLSTLIRAPMLQEHALALVEASRLIGGEQVRNAATLGGNVAHAMPAADGAIALIALNAQVEITTLDGTTRQDILSIYSGPGQNALDPHKQIISGFWLPARKPGEASAFRRVMRTQGIALPVLNLAIWLRRAGDVIAEARIAVGPSGPVPRRVPIAEAILAGHTPDHHTLHACLEALHRGIQLRTSPRRASADYRWHLLHSLLEETLLSAWERSREEQTA